jgi:hypothetical protein
VVGSYVIVLIEKRPFFFYFFSLKKGPTQQMDNNEKKRSRDDDEDVIGEYCEAFMVLGELEKEFYDNKRFYPITGRYASYYRLVHMLACMFKCERWVHMKTPGVFAKQYEWDDEDDQDTDEDDKERIADHYREITGDLCEAFDYFEEKYWWKTKQNKAASDHINELYTRYYDLMMLIAHETYCASTVKELLKTPINFAKRHQPRQ